MSEFGKEIPTYKYFFEMGKLGLSTEDTISALKLLIDDGFEGHDAIISFKELLYRLESEPKNGVSIKLGFKDSFHDKDGKLKSLDGIIKALRASLEGLSESNLHYQLHKMFGASALRAAWILYKAGNKPKDKLLTIGIDDIDSVPTVYYKGEEIVGKSRVSFDWKTRDCNGKYPAYINVEHVDTDSEAINTKTIRHNWAIEDGEINR